jgi:hypothetical protein
VDVTPLKVGQTIKVGELKPIAGVAFLDDKGQPVVACVEPVAEIVVEELVAAEVPAEGAPEAAAAAAAAAAGDGRGGRRPCGRWQGGPRRRCEGRSRRATRRPGLRPRAPSPAPPRQVPSPEPPLAGAKATAPRPRVASPELPARSSLSQPATWVAGRSLSHVHLRSPPAWVTRAAITSSRATTWAGSPSTRTRRNTASPWRKAPGVRVGGGEPGDLGPGRTLWLVKPQTYMNESGRAVAALARYHRIAPEAVAAVYDDLTIDLGLVKVSVLRQRRRPQRRREPPRAPGCRVRPAPPRRSGPRNSARDGPQGLRARALHTRTTHPNPTKDQIPTSKAWNCFSRADADRAMNQLNRRDIP